jgi:hypothetical protein
MPLCFFESAPEGHAILSSLARARNHPGFFPLRREGRFALYA